MAPDRSASALKARMSLFVRTIVVSYPAGVPSAVIDSFLHLNLYLPDAPRYSMLADMLALLPSFCSHRMYGDTVPNEPPLNLAVP